MTDDIQVPGKYKRVLLKLSGEAFADPQHGFGIDPRIVASIARQIAEAKNLGTELALVIGGGNIIRGLSASAQGTDRTTADYMGMLSTVINALGACRTHSRRRASRHPRPDGDLDAGACRALHQAPRHPPPGEGPRGDLRRWNGQPVLLDRHDRSAPGARDQRRSDPQGDAGGGRLRLRPRGRTIRDAQMYPSICYLEVLSQGLKVMDSTAITLCMDNRLPIVVFNLKAGNIVRILQGEDVGTLVHADAKYTGRIANVGRRQERGAEAMPRSKMQKAVSHNSEELATSERAALARHVLNRDHRRLLRHPDAAEPGSEHLRSRAPSDRDRALRPELDLRDRESDPELVRPRYQPQQRRQGRIRLAFPELTEDRRKELTRSLTCAPKKGRVAVRAVHGVTRSRSSRR